LPFNYLGCGGVLWKIADDDDLRFTCHEGHAYTAASLIQEQSRKIEETLWTAFRMFEERKNLITQTDVGDSVSVGRTARERAEIANVHNGRIRQMLTTVDHSIN